jgi:stress-induced morphogen
MTRADRISAALQHRFPDAVLAVQDDSARHAGHAGAHDGGETHYTVQIVTPAFTGLNRVARHRLVNAELAAEFASGLHALSLILLTPEEAQTAA